MKKASERSVTRWPGGETVHDLVVLEEPLEIRVEGKPVAITMRTPGHDLELAAGFLFTEGVIDGPDDLQALAHVDLPGDRQGNTVDTVLAGGVAHHREALERATRERYATSSCGICGKASIDRLHTLAGPLEHKVEPVPALLCTLPAQMRAQQATFHATGGLHAAALFDLHGTLRVIREDVGRHNAVDKVLGWSLLQDQAPVDDAILVVSSRAGFEIVQKAAMARVPIVAAVGAASSLAIDLAEEIGIALFGFVSKERANRYS